MVRAERDSVVGIKLRIMTTIYVGQAQLMYPSRVLRAAQPFLRFRRTTPRAPPVVRGAPNPTSRAQKPLGPRVRHRANIGDLFVHNAVRATPSSLCLYAEGEEDSQLDLSTHWLRDSCQCELCVSPHSGQKRFATVDVPEFPEVASAAVSQDQSLQVEWRKADVLADNRGELQEVLASSPPYGAVVHTLGTLLEGGEYKQSVRDSNPLALVKNLFPGSRNPLKRDSRWSYETMNKQSGTSRASAFPPTFETHVLTCYRQP